MKSAQHAKHPQQASGQRLCGTCSVRGISARQRSRSSLPTIFVWDLTTGALKGNLPTTQPIQRLSITPDGKRALSSDGISVDWWDLTTLSLIEEVYHQPIPQHSFTVAKLSPDATQFVVTDREFLQAFKFGGSDPIFKVFADAAGFDISPDGKLVATYTFDNIVTLWDATNGNKLKESESTDDSIITSVSFSPNGTWLATGALTNNEGVRIGVRLRKANDLTLLNTLYFGFPFAVDPVVVFNDNSTRIVFSSWLNSPFFCNSDQIPIWDFANSAVVGRAFSGHTGPALCIVECAKDADCILSGAQDGTLLLWKISTSQVSRRLRGHTGPVSCAAISGDGMIGISGQSTLHEDANEAMVGVKSGTSVGFCRK
jgi:WD40 repeat protein